MSLNSFVSKTHRLSGRLVAIVAVSVVFALPSVSAASDLDISNFGDFSEKAVQEAIATVGVGGAHSPYMSATPQGIWGFDIGATLTMIKLPSEFRSTLKDAGADIGSGLPLPRLHLSKGLPMNIDFGASFIKANDISLIGFNLQYAVLGGGAVLPAVSVRASYTKSEVVFLETKTFAIDVVASKKLALIFDPYIGVGLQNFSGELNVPSSATGLPVGVSDSYKKAAPHFFVGLPIDLAFLTITGQADFSTAGVSNFGAKFSLGF